MQTNCSRIVIRRLRIRVINLRLKTPNVRICNKGNTQSRETTSYYGKIVQSRCGYRFGGSVLETVTVLLPTRKYVISSDVVLSDINSIILRYCAFLGKLFYETNFALSRV